MGRDTGILQLDFVDRKIISGILAYGTLKYTMACYSLSQMYHRQEYKLAVYQEISLRSKV